MFKIDFMAKLRDLNKELKCNFAINSGLIPELEEYKLVYWKASYLYKMLKGYEIEHNDIKYRVTMINCDLVKLYDIALNEPDRQIRISFRRARKHWNLPACAIIKLPAPRKGFLYYNLNRKKEQRNYNHDKA